MRNRLKIGIDNDRYADRQRKETRDRQRREEKPIEKKNHRKNKRIELILYIGARHLKSCEMPKNE